MLYAPFYGTFSAAGIMLIAMLTRLKSVGAAGTQNSGCREGTGRLWCWMFGIAREKRALQLLTSSLCDVFKHGVLMSDNPSILAKRFWVDDVPGSLVPGSRLSNLLHSHSLGKPLSPLGLRFLDENGFKSLAQFISGEISEAQFHQLAPNEQSARVEAAFERTW